MAGFLDRLGGTGDETPFSRERLRYISRKSNLLLFVLNILSKTHEENTLALCCWNFGACRQGHAHSLCASCDPQQNKQTPKAELEQQSRPRRGWKGRLKADRFSSRRDKANLIFKSQRKMIHQGGVRKKNSVPVEDGVMSHFTWILKGRGPHPYRRPHIALISEPLSCLCGISSLPV